MTQESITDSIRRRLVEQAEADARVRRAVDRAATIPGVRNVAGPVSDSIRRRERRKRALIALGVGIGVGIGVGFGLAGRRSS